MKKIIFILPVILSACTNNIDEREEWIKSQGYHKTDLTYEQLLYSSYSNCIEHNDIYYCY